MEKDHLGELQRAIRELGEHRHETGAGWRDGAIELKPRTEGPWVYLLFLAMVLGIPAWLLLDDPDRTSYVAAALWLAVFAPVFYSLCAADMVARFERGTGMVEVGSANPLVLILRKLGMGWRYGWEGRHALSGFRGIEIRARHYGKSGASRGFRLYLVPDEGRAVQFAEFRNLRLAERACEIISEMTGLEGSCRAA
jgi:hypothetical protein